MRSSVCLYVAEVRRSDSIVFHEFADEVRIGKRPLVYRIRAKNMNSTELQTSVMQAVHQFHPEAYVGNMIYISPSRKGVTKTSWMMYYTTFILYEPTLITLTEMFKLQCGACIRFLV